MTTSAGRPSIRVGTAGVPRPVAEQARAAPVDGARDQVAAARERVEQMEESVAHLSHDLRSGMTVVLTALDVLTTHRGPLDARGREALVLLTDEVQQQRRLLTELLELARVQAPRPDRAPTPLLAVVRDTLARHRCPAGVVVQAGGQDVCVDMDPVRLGRVLANLLDNAARHAGGATAVHVGRFGDRAWVAVDDAGPGVPPGAREHVFTRFRTAAASGGREGSHLGLALCREHARRWGGDVLVDTAAGGGARFTVVLPVAEPPSLPPSPGVRSGAAIPRGKDVRGRG